MGGEAGTVDAHTNKTKRPTNPLTDAQSQHPSALVCVSARALAGSPRPGASVAARSCSPRRSWSLARVPSGVMVSVRFRGAASHSRHHEVGAYGPEHRIIPHGEALTSSETPPGNRLEITHTRRNEHLKLRKREIALRADSQVRGSPL